MANYTAVLQAFDTVPRGLLWQLLETAGICGPTLDCIKSLSQVLVLS